MLGTTEADAYVERARVLALLFGSGAGLVAVALVFPFFPDADTTALWTIVALAGVVTAGLLLAAGRVAFPDWLLPVTLAAGTLMVSAGSYYGGVGGSALVPIFFIYASAYSFYYFSLRVAIAETVLIAVGYGAALALLAPETAIAQWIIVVGASTVAGATIGGAGARVQRLWQREREVAERLREVDEMKTALLRAVAHDVRTPLMSIGGFARLLRDRDDLTEDEREMLLERIVANVDSLSALVEDVLQLDRIAAGSVTSDLEETDLVEVVGRAVDSVAEADRDRVRVTVDRPVVAPVDPPRLERAIANLVSNALRYAPDGSLVEVRVDPRGDEARVEVADRGPGVHDELKESIFEPFVRGPDTTRASGTGLGLSLVRQFAALHGGKVWVEDRPGGGARFVLALPTGSGGSGGVDRSGNDHRRSSDAVGEPQRQRSDAAAEGR